MTIKRRSSKRTHYIGDGCELLSDDHPMLKEHGLAALASLMDAHEPGDISADEREQLFEGSRNVLSLPACPNCGGVDGCYHGCTDHD